MTIAHYILDEKRRVVAINVFDEDGKINTANLLKWGEYFGKGERKVGDTTVGESRVSTVFLGLDHNFDEGGPPILWESMVFGGELDQTQERCSGTWEQAEAMHAEVVERVQAVEALKI